MLCARGQKCIIQPSSRMVTLEPHFKKKFYEDGSTPKDVLDIKKERTEKNWLDLSSL